MRFTKRWAEHHRDVLPRRALSAEPGSGRALSRASSGSGPAPDDPPELAAEYREAALTSPPGAERKMGDDSGSGSEDGESGSERDLIAIERERERQKQGKYLAEVLPRAPPHPPREPPPARACVHLMARRGAVLDRQAAAAVLRAPLPRQGRHLHRPAPGQGRGGPPAPSLRRAVCPGALNQAPRRVRVWQMGVCGGLAVICGCVN